MSLDSTTEQELKAQIESLQNTIDGFKFCHDYRTEKKSFQYAMKFIQISELYIYKIMNIFPFVRNHFRTVKKITPYIEKQPIEKIAVFIHVYYPDVLPEILDYLKSIPTPFDLYLNIPENLDITKISINEDVTKIYRLKNIGKDMASFIHFLKDINDSEYDLILKLHTKKSNRVGKDHGNVWRKCTLDSLVGNRKRVNEIFQTMEDKSVGIVGTKELFLNYNIREENMLNFQFLLKTLKIKNKNFGYHAGSMFWFKPKALKKIISSTKISFDTFNTSKNQDDGDIEHAFERIFVLCSNSEGFKVRNFSIALD